MAVARNPLSSAASVRPAPLPAVSLPLRPRIRLADSPALAKRRTRGLSVRSEASSSVLERSAPGGATEHASSGAQDVGPAAGEQGSRDPEHGRKKSSLKVIVAGGGIGGLVFALGAKNRGIDVEVYERDLTAIRGEGQYRGPIQIQSNALAALEAVDLSVAEQVMAAGCVTGDRINGLCDGVTGEWYVKFDTFTPAVEDGLPVTRVISRMTLQEILVKAVGPDIVRNGVSVVGFREEGSKVKVELNNGETVEGDILVGADGIRSRVRELLLGATQPTYSDYTCYTGICDFVPADIETVGYRVFLGHKQYFVSSDVGHGKMQWYAFHNEAAGGSDLPNCRKQRLLKLFGGWCDDVVELIQATPEEDVLRRDIYDRIPILQWTRGRVTLLGDAAHAMQPNLGQGGCMAIEDGYQLAVDLDKALQQVKGDATKLKVNSVLQQYESERRIRVAAVHGMARMAAIMASTYRAYFGEGLGPLSFLTKYRIPHWGRVAGQLVMKIAMPLTLKWVLGGNNFALEGRAPACRLEDKAPEELGRWMTDDDALERATEAEWYLLPANERMPAHGQQTESGQPLVFIGSEGNRTTVLGFAKHFINRVVPRGESCPATKYSPIEVLAEAEHCLVDFKADHSVCATDISMEGTWLVRVNGSREKLPHGVPTRIHPGDTLQLGPLDKVGYRLRMRKPETAYASAASGASRN